MDSDPFAAWEDPTPASAPSSSKSTTKPSEIPVDTNATNQDARLSLEYQDEDPGWGVASASTSRPASPEKTRKQAPSLRAAAAAATSPKPETTILEHPSDPASDEIQEAVNPALVDGEFSAAPASTELPTLTVAEADPESQVAGSATDVLASAADAEQDMTPEDDDIDAFEDSRQEQAGRVDGSVSPEESEEKTNITADPAEAATHDDDGFDDFGEPAGVSNGAAANDDFGDFDEFETGDAQDDADFGDDAFGDDDFDQHVENAQQAAPAPTLAAPSSSRSWAPLDVTAKSNRNDLAGAVSALLPLSAAAEQHLSNVGLRQVEGPSQVLVSAESRQLWTDLSSIPSVKPIDWVRSKTRRDYLISMGVPVNLDEIHSSFASGSGGSKQLPPLQLKYVSSASRASGTVDSNVPQRSSSLKLAASSAPASAAQRSVSTSNSPRNGNSSPALGSSTNRERMAERRMQELGLGPAPAVDLRRAQELVNKTEDQLTLLSLPALKSMLRELNTLTTSTSSLLTHHLTLRESYQADSEMYNSMIKELVTGAASRFSSGGGGPAGGSNSVAGGRGDSRRSTTMGMSSSSSGKARVNSMPAGPAAMSGTRSMSPSLRGGAGTSPRR